MNHTLESLLVVVSDCVFVFLCVCLCRCDSGAVWAGEEQTVIAAERPRQRGQTENLRSVQAGGRWSVSDAAHFMSICFKTLMTDLLLVFLQATQGACNTPKPGMLDFVNKAKWDAWKSLGSISQVSQLPHQLYTLRPLLPSDSFKQSSTWQWKLWH